MPVNHESPRGRTNRDVLIALCAAALTWYVDHLDTVHILVDTTAKR